MASSPVSFEAGLFHLLLNVLPFSRVVVLEKALAADVFATVGLEVLLCILEFQRPSLPATLKTTIAVIADLHKTRRPNTFKRFL